MPRGRNLGPAALWLATTVSMLAATSMVFLYAPEEKVMGAVQKVFYFHVPAAFATYLAVAVLLGGSMAYLWTRRLRWDRLSLAANEVGLLFCTLVLITGPIWGKPAWGTWWTWEARLTSTLVLWLLLAASVLVRGYASDRETGARLAAVIGIVTAFDVPIVHKAVEWWRGHHPVVFAAGSEGGLGDPRMSQTFQVSLVAFLALFLLLLHLRDRLAAAEDRLEELVETAGLEGGTT